jgi:uncharacterized protein YndB with AHSA1/START domain
VFDYELHLEIHRPPRQVWAFYADVQNNPSYIAGLDAARLQQGKLHKPGERVYRLSYEVGRTVELPVEVLEYRPPEVMRARWTAGGIEATDALTLRAMRGGTDFAMRIEGRVIESGGLLGRLAGAVLERGPGALWNRRVEGWNRAYTRFADLLEPDCGAVRSTRCGACGEPVLAAHQGRARCTYCGGRPAL